MQEHSDHSLWVDLAKQLLGKNRFDATPKLTEKGFQYFSGYEFNAYEALFRRINPNPFCYSNEEGMKIETSSELDKNARAVAEIIRKNTVSEDRQRKIIIIGAPGRETVHSILGCIYNKDWFSVQFDDIPIETLANRINTFNPDAIILATLNYNIDANAIIEKCKARIIKLTCNLDKYELQISDSRKKDCNLGATTKKQSIAQSSKYYDVDNLFTIYTSGSTGVPKGITHSSLGLMVYAWYTSSKYFEMNENTTILTGSSTGWINGHTYAIFGPMLCGSKSILVQNVKSLAKPNILNKIISETGTSILYLPVTTIKLLRAASRLISKNTASKQLVEVVGSMGEMLAPDLSNGLATHTLIIANQ